MDGLGMIKSGKLDIHKRVKDMRIVCWDMVGGKITHPLSILPLI